MDVRWNDGSKDLLALPGDGEMILVLRDVSETEAKKFNFCEEDLELCF
jgi:hypothetical protein